MSFSDINIQELASAFMVLFAVIDITGAVPIVNDMQNNGHKISAMKAALASYILLVAFLFVGDGLLNLFSVDISSFAVAGSLVIFVLAVEMIFGIPIFKNDSPSGTASIVPLVFPLIVGAGTLTTILALRAEYHIINIIIALTLNIIVVYFVLKNVSLVEKIFGKGGVYILRKFLGIILLAISVKLFTSNLTSLIFLNKRPESLFNCCKLQVKSRTVTCNLQSVAQPVTCNKSLSTIAIYISINTRNTQRFSFSPIGTSLFTFPGAEISNSPVRVDCPAFLVQFKRIGIIRNGFFKFSLFQITVSPIQIVGIYQLVVLPVFLGILNSQGIFFYRGCKILLILIYVPQIITKFIIFLKDRLSLYQVLF